MTFGRRWCVGACFAAATCAVLGAEPRTSSGWRLRGVVLTGAQELPDAVIEIDGDRIKSVGGSVSSIDNVIKIEGVIVPGLIDLHNHLTWNVLPRWSPKSRYSNRYEWQEDPAYVLKVAGLHQTLIDAKLGCEMNRYGEIKALVNGATSGAGGLREDPCVAGLMRNLDSLSELPAPEIVYEIFPFQRPGSRESEIRSVDPTSNESEKPRAAILHVGEGVDAASRREFAMLKGHGFLKNGVTVVHAVGFTASQFAELAKNNVGLVWSPRSHIELYGRTADVVAAKAAGVTIAIAPDWSLTGSTGMLPELATGWTLSLRAHSSTFTEQDFFNMATSNPAALAGLTGTIGRIQPEAMADLLVLRKKTRSNIQSIVRSNPADVLLVMVGGKPLYGDPALLSQMLPGMPLESFTVCGESKAFNVAAAGGSFHATAKKLGTALGAHGSRLAPLAECR